MSNRNYKIYAVDFDGTLCKDAFPEIGEANYPLINYLIERRQAGDKVILWTCRVRGWLDEAIKWAKSLGLEFDVVNSNLSEQIEKWGNDTRKIYADYYIDDKAKLVSFKKVDEVRYINMKNKYCNGRCIKDHVRCEEFGKCYPTSLKEEKAEKEENGGKERKMGKAAEKSAGEYADNPTLLYGA